MQNHPRNLNFADADAFMETQGVKAHLVDRHAVFESVAYLRSQGLDADDVERCLVRYFYVDLDLLSEALTQH